MMPHSTSRPWSQIALLTGAFLMILATAGVSAENTAAPPAAPASGTTTAGTQAADKAPAAAPAVNVSKLLDETCLPSLDSTAAMASLRSRMGAKGLLAVFVNTTCPFSATAINDLPSVASVFAAQEIKSVLVNLGEAQATVGDFYSKKKLGMPVVYDTGKATQTAWAITFVPTVVVIDSTGDLVYRGGAVWADVGAATEKSLKLAAGSLKVTPKGTGKG